MNYQCNLDIFEGPLDLLLHLIKEQKMDIFDIRIAEITRQYLTYLDHAFKALIWHHNPKKMWP